MVITGVADRMPQRVKALVYLDAFVPQDGQSVNGILPLTIGPEVAARFIGAFSLLSPPLVPGGVRLWSP
jgi:hypothetical protein